MTATLFADTNENNSVPSWWGGTSQPGASSEQQQELAIFAETLLKPVSFNICDYFSVQRDLRQYVSQFYVADPLWKELKALHRKCDYLGMLGVIKGEKLREYPSKAEISSLFTVLKEHRFRPKLQLTHKLNAKYYAIPGKNPDSIFLIPHPDISVETHGFRIVHTMCFYVCVVDDVHESITGKYKSAKNKVKEDMRLAKIYKEDGEKKLNDIEGIYRKEIGRWMATTKVKVAADSLIKDRKPLPATFWLKRRSVDKQTVKEPGASAENISE